MALLLALLGACGGGDGADAPAADAQQSADGQAVQPPAMPAVAAEASCGIADFAAHALEVINQRRAAGATCGTRGSFASAAPLRWNALLAQAAAAHSADMAAMNYFSHTSLDGRSMSDRVNATGYAWASLGENIAAGYPGIDSVIDGWMRSDGHCANLMNPAFDELGLACAPGAAGSSYPQYWTQNLARAR
ncbi:MAG: CAP domain-containing protein [Rubrivivax sp.]